MARPRKNRRIGIHPDVCYYKPRGVPLRLLEQVFLGIDEFEALRLADLECKSQEEAANLMNISRATFGRIISKAHSKVADALVHGKAIQIGEGHIPVKSCECHGGQQTLDNPREVKKKSTE